MKRIVALLLVVSFMSITSAQSGRRKKSGVNKRSSSVSAVRNSGGNDLARALSLAKSGQYVEASQMLFDLSYSPKYRDQRMQIKYILGLTLHQMKLNQVSAFQFIGVVKEGSNKYIKQSLEKLSLAADALGDDTLLNYAISRINVDEFPRVHRDMLHFRIGEYQMRNKQYTAAAEAFDRVTNSSPLASAAKYQEALALVEGNQLDRAQTAFEELARSRRSAPVNDTSRVAAMMGKARVLYQKQAWDEAIEAYREIPRDSELWHDALFESSWALMRSGRFRSSLSNFQSLHSAFYDDFYLPESLLLRSIVYLYICKYDEMSKVLDLFSRSYKPVYRQIENLLKDNSKPERYFTIMNQILRQVKSGNEFDRSQMAIPYVVAHRISRDADFKNAYQYIHRLIEERNRIAQLPASWRNSLVGRYAKGVMNTRLLKAKARIGKIVRSQLMVVREELVDLIEQEGFARYEMINGRKESLKKKIAGKELSQQVDETKMRDFYIQNGYEYWPFQGEYWLDELGNYHYVGTQSCN